jgi:hypothetical protein
MMIVFVKLTKGIGHKFYQLMKFSPINAINSHSIFKVRVVFYHFVDMNEVVDHHCLSFFDNFLLIYTIKDNITQSIRD